MTELWWLAERPGRPRGPFTRDQIDDMLAALALHPGELVWSSQTGAWHPASSVAPAGPPAAPLRRPRWISGLLLTAAYGGSLTACVALIASKAVQRLDADLAAVVWPASGLILLSASVGVIAMWLRPGRLAARRPELAAVRSLVVALLGLAGVVCGSLTLYQQRDAVATLRGLRELTYQIDLDRTGKIVQVRGYIGPGFAEALATELAKPSGPDVIEIASLGGLTEEALSTAKVIEARHVKVVVREICASACLVLLMASDQRLADVGARLDFHASAPVAAITRPASLWYERQQHQRFRDYLQARGAPKDVVDEAFRIGPGKVESLNALEALRLHVLTGVIDGEMPISGERLERALAHSPRRLVRSAIYEPE